MNKLIEEHVRRALEAKQLKDAADAAVAAAAARRTEEVP